MNRMFRITTLLAIAIILGCLAFYTGCGTASGDGKSLTCTAKGDLHQVLIEPAQSGNLEWSVSFK